MQPLFTLLLCLLTFSFSYAQHPKMDELTTPGGTEYLIFVPDRYNTDNTSYPMLVYLHGAQAIGPEISCSYGKGLPGAIKSNDFFDDIPMIIIAPHVKLGSTCSSSENNDYEWDPDMVEEVVNHAISSSGYNIDVTRVFGSGISLGAKGLWDYALAYPDRLTGMAPISGNAPINNICTLDDVAVWAFHGEADGLIPPTGGDERKGSQTVVDELNDCANGPYLPAHITIFEAKGHHGWEQLYDLSSGYNIYEWFLALRKNESTDYAPIVNIGPDKTFANVPVRVEIESFVFDPNQSSLTYDWAITGPSSPSFQDGNPNIVATLNTAGTYVFKLVVSDNEGNSSSDEVTIEVTTSPSGPTVTELVLYDGKNNVVVKTLSNGDVINLNNYDASLLNVIAHTANLGSRASVRFGLNDNHNFITLNDNSISSTGYSIGNNNHKLYTPSQGKHIITATAYGDRNAINQGSSYQVSVSFTEEPLPITLLSFEAIQDKDQVKLMWSTTEEVNNSHFSIYQAVGNVNEMKLVTELPPASPGAVINYYSYSIKDAPCGMLYYQLKSYDFDGHIDQSRIVSLRKTSENCSPRVYPNPIGNDGFSVQSMHSGKIQLRLINSSGQTVKEYYLSHGSNSKSDISTGGLEPGMYFLQIRQNGVTENKKIIISGTN